MSVIDDANYIVTCDGYGELRRESVRVSKALIEYDQALKEAQELIDDNLVTFFAKKRWKDKYKHLLKG